MLGRQVAFFAHLLFFLPKAKRNEGKGKKGRYSTGLSVRNSTVPKDARHAPSMHAMHAPHGPPGGPMAHVARCPRLPGHLTSQVT